MRCAKIRKDRTAAREMPPSDQAASTVEYQNAHAAEYCEEMGLPPETRRYPHSSNTDGIYGMHSLIFFRREESQNGAARCCCLGREVWIPSHSARPRIAWATKLSRKRVPNSKLAPLADATVRASVKLMPAAATAISAKRIIQPRIFCSSPYGHNSGHALSHPSPKHMYYQNVFDFTFTHTTL